MSTQPFTLLPFRCGWIVTHLIGGALGGLLEARLQSLGTLGLLGGWSAC